MSFDAESAAEGWYPDPQRAADERYWDGSEWTSRTRSGFAGSKSTDSRSQSRSRKDHPGLSGQAYGTAGIEAAGTASASLEYLRAIALAVVSGVIATPFVVLGAVLVAGGSGSAALGVILLVAGGGVAIGMSIAALIALTNGNDIRRRI